MNAGWPRLPNPTYEFAQYLRELKESGSNLLVTGEVPDAVTARATRTLFGRGHRRYRVLALLDTASQLPESVPVDDDRLWVVERASEIRSVPASVPDDDLATNADDVGSIRREIAAAVDFYDDAAEGLAPAELRIGVDMYGTDDRERVRTFLERTTELVTAYGGMGHYHLRIPDDDPLVEELSPLFDARIELRQEPGQPPEQRWHVPAFDRTTSWVEL